MCSKLHRDNPVLEHGIKLVGEVERFSEAPIRELNPLGVKLDARENNAPMITIPWVTLWAKFMSLGHPLTRPRFIFAEEIKPRIWEHFPADHGSAFEDFIELPHRAEEMGRPPPRLLLGKAGKAIRQAMV